MNKNPIREEILEKLASASSGILTDDELQVLKLRWGLDSGQILELTQVAAMLSKTKETVRNLEKSALEKLKSAK